MTNSISLPNQTGVKRNTVRSSMRVEIMAWTGAIMSILAIVLLIYSIVTDRQAAIDAAQKEAAAIAQAEALQVKSGLDVPLNAARTLADALEGIKASDNPIRLSRAQVNAMLKKVIEENPSFLGIDTLWEPNAFDGFDSLYAGKPGYDETGRFIPYWVRRADGSVTVEPLLDYETPGAGDWYLVPRQTLKEYTIAPLIYPVGGVDTMMATFTVPIVVDGKFYGITGVDAPITFVQKIVDSVNLYNNQAEAVLLTDTGTLIAVHQSPELSNQAADTLYPDFAELQPRIAAGETFASLSPDGKYLRVFSPINIGEVGTHWSFSLIIPFSEITGPATTAAIRQSAISILLILISLVALWYFSGRLIQPISDLTKVANAITQGDLNAVADIKATNEAGILAASFNTMTSQLRGTLATLEQRVAERTAKMERRNLDLALATEIGQTVSQVRKINDMLKDAAEIMHAFFGLSYVQVYLASPDKTELILQFGTGAVGQELLSRGHRLPMNDSSINGRAAVTKRSVVIADTSTSALFRPNPLLPNIRSEIAVPLLIGENLIGVLDVQSEKVGLLTEETLLAFEPMAGQIAIAIQNSRLIADAEQTRREVESLAQRLTRTGWQDYLNAIQKPEDIGFVYANSQITPLTDISLLEKSNENILDVPIAVSGEELGSLAIEIDEEKRTPQSIDLINSVARQVASHMENLRLLESAERYRLEAEEASRRLTREGWKAYVEANAAENMSYYYDLREVQQYKGNGNHPQDEAVTLPLKVRDESVGKLAVMGISPDDAESLALANAVAERLSAHIESLRQFDETRRGQIELDKRATELQAVAEISTQASIATNIQDMLQSMVELTKEKFNLYHTHIYLLSDDNTELVLTAGAGEVGRRMVSENRRIPVDQPHSLVARAARTGQGAISNDVTKEPDFLPNPLLPNTRSEMAVPIKVGETLLGVFDVQGDVVNRFTDEDIAIKTTLSRQIAVALQNLRNFAKAQQQAERESKLNVISQKIQSATTVEAVLQIAARELGQALGAPMTIAQLSLKDRN